MISASDFKEGELEQTLVQLIEFDENKERLNAQIEEYFNSYDKDGNGGIDRKELRLFLTEFFTVYHIRAPVTDEFVDAVFRDIDENRDNMIQLEELQKFASVFVKKLILIYKQALETGADVALADHSPAVAKGGDNSDDEEKKEEK